MSEISEISLKATEGERESIGRPADHCSPRCSRRATALVGA